MMDHTIPAIMPEFPPAKDECGRGTMTASDRIGELETYVLVLKRKIESLEQENRKLRDELSFHRRGIV